MKKPVIAVDGYSSTGKSSISKLIAKELGLIHMDTGALYRAVTFYAIQNCLNDRNEIDLAKLLKNLDQIHLDFRSENGELVLYLNNENITDKIRTSDISENVSFVAKQPEIRDFLLHIQRSRAQQGGIIMDGRDIGTVVLPDADYKFFLTASADERTKRRFLEMQSLGLTTDEKSVKENLIKRDKIDSERTVAPLKKADDAILIDNTNLNKNETLALILSYITNI
ncbi:(d)CMP kinase [Chryseobacterium sp.]|uniref:(d)CMP kinase n=1 Tax=Chryseobacterium sp. TaxID=1871047 RepID=UPI0011CC5041|nr:(d)CMP kinase [Chryseobacterium sp.]TXF79519.1 (d)CMP kinase [Chryseobacterium sp.]